MVLDVRSMRAYIQRQAVRLPYGLRLLNDAIQADNT